MTITSTSNNSSSEAEMKLQVLESRLFDCTSRTEQLLLELGPNRRQLALDYLLNIPTKDAVTSLDMLEIAMLLEEESNECKSASDLCQVYQNAFLESWKMSSHTKLEEKMDSLMRMCELKTDSEMLTGFFQMSSDEICQTVNLSSTNHSDLEEHEDFLKTMASLSVTAMEQNSQSVAIPCLDDDDMDLDSPIPQPPLPTVQSKKPRLDSSDTSRQSSPVSFNSYYHKKPQHSILQTSNQPRQPKPSPPTKNVIEIDNDHEDQDDIQKRAKDFMTANQLKHTQELKKKGFGNGSRSSSLSNSMSNRSSNQSISNNNSNNYNNNSSTSSNNNSNNPPRKTLGVSRRKFVPPMKSNGNNENMDNLTNEVSKRVFGGKNSNSGNDSGGNGEEPVDERLKNIDPKMIETIQNEIMDIGTKIDWDDIAGLHHAKKSIQEAVIWPMQRPDIFTGLRRAPRGILLFGPPGTGKTMIGKCIASTAGCTFFSISASSLTSKWVGEGEKMVRALFAVARVHQPSVIFIDEIDSLLTQRTDGEVEASRRIKTEFLIQFDGAHVSKDEDQILVIGATNRPQEIDEAARRRLIKRYYIPLPDPSARQCIIEILLKKQKHGLTKPEIQTIAEKTRGYSGSDMDGLCREAALGPIREIPPEQIRNIPLDQVRSMTYRDFEYALRQVRASVSDKDLELYRQWNTDFGSLPDAAVTKE